MRPLHAVVMLIMALLFSSCHHGGFTQRKYLPWFSNSSNSSPGSNDEEKSVVDESNNAEEIPETLYAIPNTTSADTSAKVTAAPDPQSAVFSIALQPTDTIVKTPRQLRREARRTDQARAGRAVYYAINSIYTACLFGLLGVLLWKKGDAFTNDIGLLILLILVIIPLYFATGVASLFGIIFSVFLARKVQTNNAGKTDYPEQSKTRKALLLALTAAILLSIAAIITLPHFLDW